MFGYYLRLGFASLRRNPILTALMVLTLAVGVAASMSTLTVLYVMSGDPIPHKSDQLYVPLLDNGAISSWTEGGEPAQQLSYGDSMAMLEQAPARRQTALYGLASGIDSGGSDLPPFLAEGVAVTGDFFAMFEVPFVSGSAWSAQDDERGGRVVVISPSLAERLFGEREAVGRSVRLGETDYVVVGVTGVWRPLPKYYRLIGSDRFGSFEEFFIPLRTAIAAQMDIQGNVNCDTDGGVDPGFDGLLRSECVWIQVWAELPDAAAQAAYRDWLDGYVNEHKALGRFPRPLNNRLYDVMGWLQARGVVSNDSRLQTWLAFGFLLVCLINTIGLLLAKFTARAGEIGVRRALGASRASVFRQYLTEASVVGVVGGGLGLLLTLGGLWLIARQSSQLEAVARMDWVMLLATFVLAIAASLLAGLLPTWRACQVAPAIQLKSQ